MEYELKLPSKTLNLKSSVFTIYKYQHEFNKDIYKDIQKLGASSEDFDIGGYALTITQILYVLANTEMTFTEFANEMDPTDLLNEESSKAILEALQLLIPKKQGGTSKSPR